MVWACPRLIPSLLGATLGSRRGRAFRKDSPPSPGLKPGLRRLWAFRCNRARRTTLFIVIRLFMKSSVNKIFKWALALGIPGIIVGIFVPEVRIAIGIDSDNSVIIPNNYQINEQMNEQEKTTTHEGRSILSLNPNNLTINNINLVSNDYFDQASKFCDTISDIDVYYTWRYDGQIELTESLPIKIEIKNNYGQTVVTGHDVILINSIYENTQIKSSFIIHPSELLFSNVSKNGRYRLIMYHENRILFDETFQIMNCNSEERKDSKGEPEINDQFKPHTAINPIRQTNDCLTSICFTNMGRTNYAEVVIQHKSKRHIRSSTTLPIGAHHCIYDMPIGVYESFCIYYKREYIIGGGGPQYDARYQTPIVEFRVDNCEGINVNVDP